MAKETGTEDHPQSSIIPEEQQAPSLCKAPEKEKADPCQPPFKDPILPNPHTNSEVSTHLQQIVTLVIHAINTRSFSPTNPVWTHLSPTSPCRTLASAKRVPPAKTSSLASSALPPSTRASRSNPGRFGRVCIGRVGMPSCISWRKARGDRLCRRV